MKIIGTVGDGEFIVTATKDEIALVAGFYWSGDKDAPVIKGGATINVGAMYRRIKGIVAAETDLANAQKTLRAVADLIDPIRPLISNAAEEQSA